MDVGHKRRGVEHGASVPGVRGAALSPIQGGGNHMGPEDPSNKKKIPIIFLLPNFRKLQDDSKNVSLKIGSTSPQKLGPFFLFFLIRKTLSSGEKW